MEGLPNSVLEAMAFEKPVVSTYHAGIPMAVDHERTGLLVQEFDNNGLYKALERLIQDEQLRITFGKNGRQKVMQGFTVEIMEESLNSLFGTIISTKKYSNTIR
jgi:glycosyltransferase involved in cell wall biosynthesis